MYLVTPFIMLYFFYRAIKSDDYRGRLKERFGFKKLTFSQPVILIHSVSMGETIAATPLINQLINDYPNHQVLVTTSTPTGSAVVNKTFGNRVEHCYLPIDLIGSVKRFLKQVNPEITIVMETELWPNLIHQLHNKNIPILLANARMSERSMKSYLKKAAPLMREMLSKVNRVSAQFPSDGDRFLTLGLPKEQLEIGGSIKFELSIPSKLKQQQHELKEQWAADRLVWVAGSTHPGENEQILAAHRILVSIYPDLLLVLIPRHSERFDDATTMAQTAGFHVARRSQQQAPSKQTQVVICDTMGEMLLMLGIGDIAYIGGSLIERGGHNPLEPAALGKPIIMGPSCYNFSDICDKLINAGGLEIVTDDIELANLISHLISDSTRRVTMGNNALKIVNENQGTLARLMSWVSIQLTS